MGEREQLLSDLNDTEHLRETARRNGLWDDYQAICEKLTHLGRRLELLRIQEEQEAK